MATEESTGRLQNHQTPPSSASPFVCDECGSFNVIYDSDSDEIVCDGCGLVLNVGAEKPDAIRLLRVQPVIPRKLLKDLCQERANRRIAHEHVEAIHAPKIQHLERLITGMSGLRCKRCGIAILRDGAAGRLPEFCAPCRKINRNESSREWRHENSEKWKAIKVKSRRKLRKTGKAMPTQTQAREDLGGKPLGPPELQALGIKEIHPDSRGK